MCYRSIDHSKLPFSSLADVVGYLKTEHGIHVSFLRETSTYKLTWENADDSLVINTFLDGLELLK